MIWHEADILSQLVCIGVSVCRPIYKDWLNRVVDKVGTNIASSKSKSESGHSGGNFSVIALQTIGGSSNAGNNNNNNNKLGGARATATRLTRDEDDDDDDDLSGDIKIQRSWRVESESNSRAVTAVSTDATSEEHILGA